MRWAWMGFGILGEDPELQLELIIAYPRGISYETFYPDNIFYSRLLYVHDRSLDPEENDCREIEIRNIPPILNYNDHYSDHIEFFNNLDDFDVKTLAEECRHFNDEEFKEIKEDCRLAPYLFKLYKYVLQDKLPIIMKDYLYKDLIYELTKYL